MRRVGVAARSGAELPRLDEAPPTALAAAISAGLAEAFECLPVGALLVDRAARILLRNRPALRCLNAGLGLREQNGKLRCDFVEDSAALTRTAERLLSGQLEKCVALTPRRSDGQRPLELMLHRPAEAGSVMVFISSPGEQPGFNAPIARQLYALSDREIEVARAVVAGRTLVEIAASLRVERETVRSHLKQIFSKTQTTRQADLVRLFSTGLFAVGVEA